MPDNISKLYQELKGTYELGSENDFRKYLSDGKKREALRKELEADYEVGDSASFAKYLGLDSKPEPKQGTAAIQRPTEQVKPARQAASQSVQPIQMPQGFGELDMQQANQMGMGRGPVSWEQPEPKQETNIAKDLTNAVKGDKEAGKRSGVTTAAKRMQEEREYAEATGKPLRNIVNTPVTAPTAVKGEDGQMLMGQATDEQRVAQYQQQEREIERKKIVQPIVDDIQKQLESEVPATTVPGAMTSGDQYQAMMNQTGILQRMNQADSPEKLWDNLQGYFNSEQFLVDHQDEIAQAASRLGMNVDDFVWQELIPQMSNTIAERFNQNMSEKYSVKNTGDYLAKRMINSSIGALARMSAGVTPQQSQFMQQELEKSNEGEGAHFNARWYDKAVGEVAQFAPDAPLMMTGGVIGGAATKTVGAGLKYLGAESLGALVANGSSLLAANVGKAVKYGGILGNRIIGSAANMGSFMGMSGMLQAMASTDSTEQGYWSSIGLAGLEGLGEGIKMGTALGALGVAGGKLSSLASTAKGRAAIATGAFLAENQIFAMSDYLADPDKFNWVDSSLDAFYMMMAGRVSGLATHGTEGMKQSLQHILYGEPMKNMPRLTEDEKTMIQRAFGGMDFADIAGDVNNIGKILADKENIPLNVRQKISGATMGAFEPNRPHTYMTNVRGNEIHERAKDGELLAVHKFADVDERDRIMQEIADRKANDEMISYYNILNLRNQEGLTDELNRFCEEFQITLPEVQDIMAKKPIDRVDDEQMLMDELSKRLHDAAFPEGELHPAQSEVDGNNLAGRGPVADPNVSAQIAQEADKAKAEYDQFMQTNTDMQEWIAALGDARPDEVLMYIANNFSGTTRDEGMRIVSNYYNAEAKKNGYIQTVGDNINNYVDQEIESNGFKGTLDGAPDEANIITVTDGTTDPNTGQPRRLTLLNGDVGTTMTEAGRVMDADNSGGQIICRDENGQFVILKPDARVSVVEQMPKEDYGNNLREELGVSNTTTLVETGVVKPEDEPENEESPAGKPTVSPEESGSLPGGKSEEAPGIGIEAPAEPSVEAPSQPAVTPDSVKDDSGVKRYENGIDVDTAIADIQADGFDVNETADLAISEAQEALGKMKAPKTRAEQVKNAGKKLELQNAISYYTGLKERYKEQLAAEKALKDAEKAAERAEKRVTSQPKGKNVEEQKQERIAALKAELGELFDDDFTKANDVNELVSMWLSRGRKLSRDSVGQELGWDMGVGKDARYIETMLAKKGEGMTINDFVHGVWESPENAVDGEKRYTTEEIREALLSLFQGATSKSDVVDYAVKTREAQARRALEEQRAREEETARFEQSAEPLNDEEQARIEAGKPFEDPTDDDFPELPKSKQEQLVEEVSKILDPEVPASVIVIDAKNTSDKDWYDIASEAYGGAFPSEEDIAQLKEWMQREDGGYFFAGRTGKLYTSDHVSIDKIKELYKEIKDAYERAKEEEVEAADTRAGQADERVDDSQRENRADEGREQEPSGEDRPGEGGPEPDGEIGNRQTLEKERDELTKRRNKLLSDGLKLGIFDKEKIQSEIKAVTKRLNDVLKELGEDNVINEPADEYLFPRDEKEQQIIAEVDKLLRAEIAEAQKEVRNAKSALEKARAKESDNATDMFSDDAAFEQPDQLFSFDEMGGTDRTQEGVNRRTQAEQEALDAAQKKLDRLLSPAEWNSRVRGALDNHRRQTSFDPMAAIEQAAGDFKKEQDAAIGITREETPEQKADKEREETLNEAPLTTEEIDGADISDVQKTLAKAYLSGNHGILQEAAYLNAINDVRNRRQDHEADSTDAERGTQLDSGENQPERGSGRTGGPDLGLAETESQRDDERPVGQPQSDMEDGEGRLHTPDGKGGDSGVPESESQLDGLSAGGERRRGRSLHGESGSELGGGQPSGGSRADTRKAPAGSDAAIAASKQRLAELRKKFRDAGKRDLSISLVGMNAEQIGILGEITTEAANLGYQYLAKGVREFKEWSRQMLDDFHDWLQEDMKWSDSEIDEYLNEVWNCEYNIDGVTRSIREWASFLGEDRLREVVREDLGTKYERQKAAENIAVKVGDIDNIRETLPYLLPEQQEDVLKTETQFFDESHQDREHGNGKGMMFTNGTGTGKTYTGLGIAKRFVKQGKGRVLILTPSQEKVTDWRNDGLNLGLNLESLDEDAKNQGTSATKAKGKGVVVTTYANARQNLKLLEDCFDLIIYDESHKITEGKEAAEGEMFKFHQMLTNKDVEKSIDRQTYWLPEWIEQRNLFKEREENQKKLDTLSKIDELTQAQEELQQRLNARMPEIEKRLEELRPIMQEIRESKREQAEIDSKRTKTVFLSATPFNTRENMKYAEGYLFSYPEEDKNTIGSYNHRSPEDAFYERYFPAGYRWRYGRLENHVENAEALGRQEIDFSDYLQNQLGTLSGRMISSEYDYSRDFPVLTLDHAGRFNEAMSQVYRNKRYQPLAEAFRKSFDYNYSTALFEAMKTSLVIYRIKEHLNRGQKVVVFHRRRTSGDLEPPFERALTAAREMAALEQDGQKKAEINNAIQAFREDFADMLEWEKTLDYTLPRDQIAKVFGDDKISFFSGAENKKVKHQSVEDFIKDNGGKDIIVIQEASGKEGISLHDKTGEHQRVEINLALPQSPIAFIQIEGRIYRIGQKSNAIFEYPLLGLDLETSLFAQKFNSALGTTENLALGSKARNLRQSIANAVLENTGEIDYDRQGFGGKDMDGRVEGRSGKDGFDVAISDYYGNHKMQRGRDNREGFDYFTTPEPIGWKMVQWAQLMEGESALEPSAGHGAIARYVPESNPMTAIEPSANLFSKLQMRAGGPGRRFEEKSFEDYPLANKHDAIVMNPPYGVQGKMAMEHVAKAFKHLNEGGRLIAIIPDGPAMEKRLEAWINGRGDTTPNGTAVMTGEVKLPDVAFSRAGTSVRTRIIIIDKVTRQKMREGMPDKVTIDLTGAKTVDELFGRLRNVNMPERTIDQAAIAQKRALRTKKAFEDNKFVRNVWIDEDGINVTNRSTYGSVPELRINFNMIDNQAAREMLVRQYHSLVDTRDNVEELDYGKWKNKAYGSGKNAVPAVEAIRDYCDTAIRTIANVLKTSEDGLAKEWKAMQEAAERREQEREAEMQRIISERDREKEERIKGIVETALAENPNNSVLSEGGIEANIKIAHGNIYLMAERAKRNLREAGIDWQTGKRIERNEPVNAQTATPTRPASPQRKEPYEYMLDKNTKTGADMHLVVMNERVDDATYKELQHKAKALNDGYYNRFKKAWHFKTEEDARRFVQQLATESMKNVIDGINGGTTRFSEDGKPKKTPKTLFSEEKLNNEGEKDKSEKKDVSLQPKDRNNESREMASPDREGDGIYGSNEEATHLIKGCSVEPDEAGRVSGSKQRLLEKLEESTRDSGQWIDDVDSTVGTELQVGGENEVYLTKDGNDVIKLNDLAFLRDDAQNFDDLLNRIASQNELFPDVPLHIVGFAKNKQGKTCVVLQQPYVKDARYATQEEIDNALDEMGFYEDITGALTDDSGRYAISDLKPNNVLVDSEGNLHFVDVVTYDEQRPGKMMKAKNPKTYFSEDGTAELPQHTKKIVRSIQKTAKKLNTPVKIARSIDEVTNKDALEALRNGRRIKGWFEEGTGEIVLYLPNIADRYSGERTVAHEVVGHHGLRALLGEEGYRSYMRTLALDLRDEKLSEYMRENMARHGFDIYTTVDEYLAEAAEKGYGNLPLWQKVRDAMTNALRKAGFEMTPSISDVKYMAWLSKNQLENSDPTKAINREALLYRLGQEKYEAKVENGEFTFGEGGASQPKQGFFPGNKTLFSSAPSTKTAKQQYEKALSRLGYAWKESHIDQMQAGVELMRAIAGVKKIEDIPSVENFVLAENQMSSREEQMDYLFNRDYMEPLDKAVGAVLPEFGSNTDRALRNLQIYMVKKSGLERNRCLYVRDKIREYRKDADMDQNAVQQLEDDWNQLLDEIRDDIRKGNIDLREYLEQMDAFIRTEIDPKYKADGHDYSGLTAMASPSTGQKGYDDDTIIDEVMSTESMVGDERISNLWEKTKAVSQYGLDMEYEGGLDSKEKHDRVSRMFEWYVPMRGYDETTAEEVYDYLEENKGSKWVGPVLMNAKGRESQSDVDIFAQLGAMSSHAINRALRNQMKQTFARFVRNHYHDGSNGAYGTNGDNRLVTELKYLWGEKRYDPTTGNEYWEEVFPDIPENATADEVAQIVEDFENDMKTKEGAGDAKRMRQNSSIPFRPSAKNKAKHIVEVYINGEKKTFVVNGNPRAAMAVNGELKSETNHRMISRITRTMAQLNTSYNPDFIVGNTERDYIFSSAAILAKESPKYFAQWQANYFGRGIGRGAIGVPAMHTNLFKRYRENNLDMSNATDRYFKEFMENGGETGWVESKNLEKWKKEIRKGVRAQGTPEKVGRFVVDAIPGAIEAMNERAENAARFATYMTSRQMGRSVMRSVSDAKEISVNFNRKGSGLKTKDFAKNDGGLRRMNAIVAARTAQFGQDYIMFYNAGVQGLNNASKIMRDHPVKASTIFAGFALGALVMSQLNQSLINDEDPQERGGIQNPYAELPEWIRRNRLCLYIGKGEFATVDLPIELRALYGIGDIAAAYTTNPELRSEKPVWQDVMTQMTQILPIDFMGEHPGEPWMSFVPSFAMPFAEVAMNQNWYGRKIEKDQYVNEDDPRWTRAYKNANKAYIDASKGLNAATNQYSRDDLRKMGIKEEDLSEVDARIKGSADGKLTDPALVEHIVNGYFGGAGQTAGRLADVFKSLGSGESFGDVVKSPQMPIARRLHYSPTEQNKMARTRSKWWHYKDEMDEVNNEVKKFKEYGVVDPLSKMKQISVEDSVRATRAKLMNDAQKQYRKLKKQYDKTGDEAIQMRMDQLMENTVRGFDAIR